MEAHLDGERVREREWFVAQCLEVDVASQGENEEAALRNLREGAGSCTLSRR